MFYEYAANSWELLVVNYFKLHLFLTGSIEFVSEILDLIFDFYGSNKVVLYIF